MLAMVEDYVDANLFTAYADKVSVLKKLMAEIHHLRRENHQPYRDQKLTRRIPDATA
jgi:hypothetical protein